MERMTTQQQKSRGRLLAALVMAILLVFTMMPASVSAQTVTKNGTKAVFSSTVDIKTALPAKANPTALKLTGQSGKIRLDWTNVAKKGASISGYLVFRKAGKGTYQQIAKVGKNRTYYIDTKAKKNTTYTYIVYAYRVSGKKIRISSASPYATGVTSNSTKKNAYTPKINKKSATILTGKTVKLGVTYPKNSASTATRWRSSNAKVATVNGQGLVTGKGAGTATIYAKTANGREVTCKVTVKKPVAIGTLGTLKGSVNSAGKATLTWGKAANAKQYTVRYRMGEGAWTTKTTTATAYTITGLANGKTYQFQVRGQNGSVVGNWLTIKLTVPAKTTTGNTGSAGNNDNTGNNGNTGNTGNNDGTGEQGYTPKDDDTPSGSTDPVTPDPGTDSDTEDPGNTDPSTGGNTNPGTGSTDPVDIGYVGGTLHASYSDTEITYSWAAATNATSYDVAYRQVGTEEWTTNSVESTVFTATGLQENTSYEFRVRGRQGDAVGSWRTWGADSEKGAVTTAISWAKEVHITYSSEKMVLTFTEQAGTTGYIIQYKKAGQEEWTTVETTELTYQFPHVEKGSTYEIRVARKIATGQSGWSTFSPITLPGGNNQ